MTPTQKAEYRENFAAEMAIIVARKELAYDGVSKADIDAATIAALWRALELASKGMSKEALKRMVFGNDAAAEVREALKVAREALAENQAQWKSLADSGDFGNWFAEDQLVWKQSAAAIARIDALDVGK